MRKIVTNYLIEPTKSVEKTPILETEEAHQKIWLQARMSKAGKALVETNEKIASIQKRSSDYIIQGLNIPLFNTDEVKEPLEKAIDVIVLFIAGSNAHLFSCRQRAIECAYAAKVAVEEKTKNAKVVLSRFNPFGVINKTCANHAVEPFYIHPLREVDITGDYYECAKLLLNKYHNSQMIIMGHSLGGIFARKVYAKLKNCNRNAKRVKCVYSAMSLPGIADAFMYYQPSTMLRNLIPKKNEKLVGGMINMINKYGFKCVQRLLKVAVEYSGWRTIKENINQNELAQSNLEKINIDRCIPDQVASVQDVSVMNWLLSGSREKNCHDLPPTELFYEKDKSRISELDQLIITLKMMFYREEDVATEG